jgi:hypothetical protein
MARKRRKAPQDSFEAYIFEIKDWQPAYSLSVNASLMTDGPYLEHTSAEIAAVCVFPKRLSGIISKMSIVGDRRLLTPEILEFDKRWKPKGIGVLTLAATGLDFYGTVPHDALLGVFTALAAERWRYVLLYGAALRRKKSICRSIEFECTVNLDDY